MSRGRHSFAGLVAGEAERTARLTVPAAEVEEALALARNHGWLDTEDGENWPLLFVAFGLAALRQERAPAQQAAGQHPVSEGRVAALRYAAFTLAQSNRILRIKQQALRIDNRGMRLRLQEEEP